MDKATVAQALRNAADLIEKDDPKAYKHATVLSFGIDCIGPGDMVSDRLYSGSMLILSSLPISNSVEEAIRQHYRTSIRIAH